MDDRILTCALHYASFGWRVLPLYTIIDGKCNCGDISGKCKPGKHPYSALVPNGSINATSDESSIRSWFSSGIPLNIGICAGAESGLVILDVDPAHGGNESLAALEQKYGPLPQTTEVITGSGGRHFYFKHPGGDIRNSAGTLGAGLDVRGHNGYVVAPPSVHLSGNEYKWKIDPRGLMPTLPPSWLITVKEALPEPTVTATDEMLTEGKRNDRLYRMACSMRNKGFDHDAIYQALAVFNEKNCSPPLDPKELRGIAQGASKYKPAPPSENEHILLPNDHPDTISDAFAKWSREDCSVIHRYNQIDGWSIYHNSHYQKKNVEAIEKYIRDFIGKYIKIKAKKKNEDGTSAEIYVKPDIKTKKSGHISDIVKWLLAHPCVYLLPGSQMAPCSLNGQLDHRYIIALQNGLLDWSSYPYVLRPHTPDFYTFNYLPYCWEGDVESDMWIDYLVDATGGDEDLHALLQQWAGYCLMVHLQEQQKFMLCYGEAMTGKSVYCDVITALLGKENVSAIPLEKFNDIHMVTDTYGKTLNLTDESEECVVDPAVENALKHYTGGTLYPFKRLYSAPFSAYPTAKIMISTNHLPKFKDSSEGIWRRMLLAPFKNVVPADREVKGLAKKIIATEMPGVLNWALAGARHLMATGRFIEPAVSKTEMTQYKKDTHPEYVYLEENFEPSNESLLWVKCNVLRGGYEAWCKAHGYGPKNDTNLGKAVKKCFPGCERIRGKKGGTNCYQYRGLKIKNDSELLVEGQKYEHGA